jgi:hypothetical protein
MDDVEELLGLAPLDVGQRVRVRLGGEATGSQVMICNDLQIEVPVSRRYLAVMDGATGTVARRADDAPEDQRYWIDFDAEISLPSIRVATVGRIRPRAAEWAFARAELERTP